MDTFVTKHRSLVAEINSIYNIYYLIFLPLRTLSDISVPIIFSSVSCHSDVFFWRRYWIDVMSGSLATSKISSTVGVWSYDKSRSCIISDTSFKVNGTILDWFNIDFSGVETYRIVVQSIQSFSFGLWLLVFSRKECFSYNRILGGINSVFNNLLQRIDNRFEIIGFSNAIFSFILPIFKAWYFLRT